MSTKRKAALLAPSTLEIPMPSNRWTFDREWNNWLSPCQRYLVYRSRVRNSHGGRVGWTWSRRDLRTGAVQDYATCRAAKSAPR